MIEFSNLLVIVVILAVMFLFVRVTGSAGFIYMKYRRAYKDYQRYVVTNFKSYDIYVYDFKSSNKYIDHNKGVSSTSELNKKNEGLTTLFDLLENGNGIVSKFFSKPTFGFTEYRDLKSEWAQLRNKLYQR